MKLWEQLTRSKVRKMSDNDGYSINLELLRRSQSLHVFLLFLEKFNFQ